MTHLQSLDGTVLMVIDVQDNHFPHCFERETTLDIMSRVIEAAQVLRVPIVLTEHHPKAFGPTVQALAKVLEDVIPLPKIHFSCLGDPGITARIEELGAKTLVLIGAETHICICQTALKALERGLGVAVVADAVTDRKVLDHDIALHRLRSHGVDVLTWESLVYEWLERGGTDEFRKILPIVKR